MHEVLPRDVASYLRFALIDAGHIDPEHVGIAAPGAGLIFDSRGATAPSPIQEKSEPGQFFATVLPMTVGGRKWDIHFSAPKTAYISGTQALAPRMVLAGGILSVLLLGGLVHALMSSRRRAVGLAHAMTRDLRESKQLLQAIIDNSAAVIFVKDLEGRYLLVNRHLEEVFHREHDSMVGLNTYDLVPPEYAAALRAFDQEVIQAGRALEAEEIVPQDDGVHTYLSIKAPLFDEAGKPYAICAVATDITDRKRAEEELKRHRDHLEDLVKERTAELTEAKDKAEVANQAKSTFLASMSHELRTPLNAILGYAQILKRNKELDDRQTTGLNTIQQSGEHLLTLINDILDLAKIEAGKLELYPDAVNPQAFLRVIADIIRVKAEQKSLLFLYEVDPDTPRAVSADEKRLRQILLNLLGNAVKFTDRGQVALRVRCVSGCAGANSIARLRFDIEDTGVGMTPAQLTQIFRPFEQVGAIERRAGGTGLGLAVSRQLVRLMGSDIQVESQPGRGSRFWFELSVPVAAEMAAMPAERAVTGYQGPRKKILIVDDVVANRAMLVDLLSELGFDTAEAVNGQDALDRIAQLQPDLIVMDMVMPVMNGLEATHRVRQLPQWRDVPIIAVSASASQEDQAASLAAGVNVFLAKPIIQLSLLKQIGALLSLDWQYEQSEADAQDAIEAVLVAPPRQELESLYQLALLGNMRAIREWAAQLAARDARYGPFAGSLLDLASRYQSKEIVKLVGKHMNPDAKA
ncbi:MAG: response regulator [Burkholderiales bacterium]|nr:response regulator [Burkholderiales bacterium]